MTPAQKAEKDYYISDYPSSQITAGNISYDNTESGMDATELQSAVDELKGDLTNVVSDMPVKVFKGSVPENGSIGIQLELNRLYQYYTWRDSEVFVYMGLIDVAYTGLITNHPIIKPQVEVLLFTDGGNLTLTVTNASDYQASILLYKVSI